MAGAGRLIRPNGVPYYIQVADHLRQELREGRWAVGELIPSEAALCDLFGVSRTAIRQALGELVAEGLLHKQRGRGTFVSRPHVSLAVQETRGFFDEMVERGHAVETEILRQSVVDIPPEFAPELALPMGSQVLRIERIRRVATENLVYVTTFLPLPRFAGLVDRDLSRASLYAVLAEDFGVRASSGRRRIEALKATDVVAKHLAVRRNEPTLRVTAVNYDADGQAFEAFEAHYRADRTAFEVDVAAH
jgi:GntR family transcriptional regulator